jgi:hypothetical protein
MDISAADSKILIVKPLGQAIPLRLGEIIRAEIVDVLATGGITLKIKGSTITARTNIPLEKDAAAFFKVLAKDRTGAELTLQFMGYEDAPATKLAAYHGKSDRMQGLIQNIFSKFLKGGVGEKDITSFAGRILGSLQFETDLFPKELRAQLQTIVQDGFEQKGFFQMFPSLPWKELKDGDITFKKGYRDAEEDSCSCRIQLDLKDTGQLTINVLMINSDFYLAFRTDNDAFNTLLGSNMDALQDIFREKGLNLRSVHVLGKDSLMEEPGNYLPPDNLINIKA